MPPYFCNDQGVAATSYSQFLLLFPGGPNSNLGSSTKEETIANPRSTSTKNSVRTRVMASSIHHIHRNHAFLPILHFVLCNIMGPISVSESEKY